ncbi:MAG: tRNA (adenosine(37)-N6)-threonylcarbamoyltransferase complex transferase subunit TsaD [Planctomycetota bacterium]|jgi:N6-L-threonylcarbamoyladenine synthase
MLGIETSCDETAVAVVAKGSRIRANLVASQVNLHAPFHGVVPEIAARAHEATIRPLLRRALEDAGCTLSELEGIAVTVKPGLIGALLVGLAAAKGISLATGIPLIGVNHLEAHIHAVRMDRPDLPHPLLALVASGGHTCLYRVDGLLDFELLGTTLDDAAGEAFDKVASLLGLSYPGGPSVETAARGGKASIPFPVAHVKKRPFHFSFSGLKTAVLYHLKDRGWGPLGKTAPPPEAIPDLAASFQEAAVKALVRTTKRAFHAVRPASVILAGGVALNRRLRETFVQTFSKTHVPVHFPPDALCGDNAAMVAGLGAHRLRRLGPDGLDVDAEARVIGKSKG